MVSYARRACSECGVREPQPGMYQFEVIPIGVHGNFLAPRLRWFCEFCAQPKLIVVVAFDRGISVSAAGNHQAQY